MVELLLWDFVYMYTPHAHRMALPKNILYRAKQIERVVFEDEALSAGNEEFLDFC